MTWAPAVGDRVLVTRTFVEEEPVAGIVVGKLVLGGWTVLTDAGDTVRVYPDLHDKLEPEENP